MSKKKATLASFEQTAYQRAELAAFQRMLNLSEGTFSLSVALCNSPALRDHLIAHVTQEVDGIEVARIAPDTQDIFDSVKVQVADVGPRAIFVAGVETALKDGNGNRVLQGLNASRESWQSRYRCPVVFWLPEYAVALLAAQARDLWSWVSHSFEFVSEQATALTGMQDAYAGQTSIAGNLDVHEKQFRMAELRQRLADVGNVAKGQLTQHALVWLNELAYLYRSIGDLDRAEKILQKSLQIFEKLGHPEGMAVQYGNLALICQTRGDLDQAEKMLNKSLEIDKKLGNLEGMAIQYGNLGLIHQVRGDLDQAERLLNKALEIFEKLGRIEGIASTYANLGTIYQTRGDLDQAETMHNKSLEIEKKLGQFEGMASDYGNLGVIYRRRGDLDRAQTMLNKSLEINQKLGRLEGMASDYGNLAMLCELRGDLATAREYWSRVRALYEQIGVPHMVARIQGWIDGSREAQQ